MFNLFGGGGRRHRRHGMGMSLRRGFGGPPRGFWKAPPPPMGYYPRGQRYNNGRNNFFGSLALGALGFLAGRIFGGNRHNNGGFFGGGSGGFFGGGSGGDSGGSGADWGGGGNGSSGSFDAGGGGDWSGGGGGNSGSGNSW